MLVFPILRVTEVMEWPRGRGGGIGDAYRFVPQRSGGVLVCRTEEKGGYQGGKKMGKRR